MMSKLQNIGTRISSQEEASAQRHAPRRKHRPAQQLPSNVESVLQSPGKPLEAHLRADMEARFAHDFSGVRVHTDDRAARSARSIAAHAYSSGTDIVFGAKRYAPYTQDGRRLLAHELAHIAQGNGRQANRPGLGAERDRYETNADQVATAALNNFPVSILTGAPSAIRLTRDPNLDRYLARLRAAADEFHYAPYSDAGLADAVLERLEGLNLTDPDNLMPVLETLNVIQFPSDALPILLARIDARAQEQGQLTALERARQEHEHQRMIQALQNLSAPRRGPYGTRGPGVIMPVIAEGVVGGVINLFRSAVAFIQGLVAGFRDATSQRDASQLLVKLGSSVILTTIFPVIFVAGAVVGIVEDIVGAIKSLYNTIVNFEEIMATVREILRVMMSDQGAEAGRAMGIATGQAYARRIQAMLQQNIFSLTYNLGRLVGPTIVYALLSLLGLPAIVGIGIAGVSARVIRVFSAIVRRIPGLRRLQILLRRRRGRGGDGANGPLLMLGGRVRFTLADLLRWERMGGHALQRHGPFHTRDTLLYRILDETSLGGLPEPPERQGRRWRPPDFRIWRGQHSLRASRWQDNDSMLRSLDEIINQNIDEIQRVTSGGGRARFMRQDMGRTVGQGWVTAIRDRVDVERGIYWADDLRHATVIIDPHPDGGWYVVTAYPDLPP